MPRHERIKSGSGYYHIMLRGNERNYIFKSDVDKQRFMEIMLEKKDRDRYFLHAFCLMDNHVHLMLREGSEDVATLMKRITVSYVHYFNKKYKRVGHLFQDRFKSEAVEQDSYLLTLARYIHQNPVKAGMVKRAFDYEWSSYNYYINDDNLFTRILDTDTLLGLLSGDKEVAVKKYIEFMNVECDETFLDLKEEVEVMNEEDARKLFQKMIMQQKNINDGKVQIPDDLIKELREKTNLSARMIATITGLNKDKVSYILKS